MSVIGGSPRTGFFYPRIVYGTGPTTINFDDAATPRVPEPVAVRGDNISTAGRRESLFTRLERVLTIIFPAMDNTKFTELHTYVTTWALLGEQAAVTLDRLSTCAGQFEFDVYNTFFTKAELLELRWSPQRAVLSRPFYTVTMTFRQGQ